MQRVDITRFRKRNDAEDHRNALHRLTPEANYAIVFDPQMILKIHYLLCPIPLRFH